VNSLKQAGITNISETGSGIYVVGQTPTAGVYVDATTKITVTFGGAPRAAISRNATWRRRHALLCGRGWRLLRSAKASSFVGSRVMAGLEIGRSILRKSHEYSALESRAVMQYVKRVVL
jgi:hypothetical protein